MIKFLVIDFGKKLAKLFLREKVRAEGYSFENGTGRQRFRAGSSFAKSRDHQTSPPRNFPTAASQSREPSRGPELCAAALASGKPKTGQPVVINYSRRLPATSHVTLIRGVCFSFPSRSRKAARRKFIAARPGE